MSEEDTEQIIITTNKDLTRVGYRKVKHKRRQKLYEDKSSNSDYKAVITKNKFYKKKRGGVRKTKGEKCLFFGNVFGVVLHTLWCFCLF